MGYGMRHQPTQQKRWVISATPSRGQLERLGEMSPLLAQLLYLRGVRNEEDAQRFLHGAEFPREPEKLSGVPAAVQLIFTHLHQGGRMIVYGDYDADGITATAVLVQTLEALGARVAAYIPNRVEEGYGLNLAAIQHIAAHQTALIITVDCGIRNHQEVQAAREAGMDIVITDHHSVGASLPEANVVINPKLMDPADPTQDLAGVGVAFMLAYALLREQMNREGKASFPDFRLSDLLDLVAIGTIADMMPLNDQVNRRFVQEGMKVLRENRRLGLQALAATAGIHLPSIEASQVAYRIAPRLNAAGRLADASLALQLLLCRQEAEAFALADQLNALNQQRQVMTNAVLDEIRQGLIRWDRRKDPLICAGDERYSRGIVGLVAGRLAEEWHHPSVIWEKGETYSHASCRSIPGFNLMEALDQCDDLLIQHGGHVSAAGFTVHNDQLDTLVERLQAIARSALRGKELLPILNIDLELSVEQVDAALLDELERLEPTGLGNPQPLFLLRNLPVKAVRCVGKLGKHLSFHFASSTGRYLRGIAFNQGERKEHAGTKVDLVTYLENNYWQGRRSINLNIQDFRTSH